MRVSFWLAVPTLALGILFSSMADSLIAVQTVGRLQTISSLTATVLFVMFSAFLLGFGAATLIHWIFSYGNRPLAFGAEMFLSFALFFIGVGGALTIGVLWTGLQLFFTFAFGSATLFLLSFVTLFGGVAQGASSVRKYVKRRFRQQQLPAAARASAHRRMRQR